MSDTVSLEAGVVEPPDTVLTELLTVFQGVFNKTPQFQLMEPPNVVARILDEDGNMDEILRFMESYLDPSLPNAYQVALNGMSVMFCLGYLFARGEKASVGKVT